MHVRRIPRGTKQLKATDKGASDRRYKVDPSARRFSTASALVIPSNREQDRRPSSYLSGSDATYFDNKLGNPSLGNRAPRNRSATSLLYIRDPSLSPSTPSRKSSKQSQNSPVRQYLTAADEEETSDQDTKQDTPLIPTPILLLNTIDWQALMDYRSRMRPVQLFGLSSSNPNVLKLNKHGLNTVLGHSALANRKIVVISITGAYRKGKSFLLNFFLEYLWIQQFAQKRDEEVETWLTDETLIDSYFHYKAGPKRNTTGIWIWPEPFLIDSTSGERFAVLLMDVQGCIEQQPQQPMSGTNSARHGIPSSGTGASSDSNNIYAEQAGSNNPNYGSAMNNIMLVLSTLLSSIQLYNFAEFIPEEAIKMLSFFNDYQKLAREETEGFGLPFQKLAFVIRDYKITDNELIYGAEGGHRYLERLLAQSLEAKSGGSIQKILENLPECFSRGTSCYLIPHPGTKVLDSGFSGQVKDIKPAFRDEIVRLIESLVHPAIIQAKMLNERPVTVRKFMECVREYSRIFDSLDNFPDTRTLLNVNIQLACSEYALEAKIAYCKAMDRTTRSSRMLPEKRLLEQHIKHGIKALNIYDRCPKGGALEIRGQQLARLQESINKELEHYQRLNDEKRVTTCASAMLACGDSPFLGLGLGGAASGAIAGALLALQLGVVSAGVIAIPASLVTIFGIWVYVSAKPCVKSCFGIEKADPDEK